MTPTDIFNGYLKLSAEERSDFHHQLSMYLLLNLPDGDVLMLSKEEFTRLHRRAAFFLAIKREMEPFFTEQP